MFNYLSEKLVVNIVMGLLSLVSLGIYFLGRAFSRGGAPESTEIVHLLPMGLFVTALALQFFLQETKFGLYVAFLPLLYFIALPIVSFEMARRNEKTEYQALEDHKNSNASILSLAPLGTFVESAEYYLVRKIVDEADRKLFAVVLETPRNKINDFWGHRNLVQSSHIEIFLLHIRGKRVEVFKSRMIDGLEVNPYLFSNLGYYSTRKLETEPHNLHFIIANQEQIFVINENDLSFIEAMEKKSILSRIEFMPFKS